MNPLRLSVMFAIAVLSSAFLSNVSSAQPPFQNPAWINGPPIYSSGPQYYWPNPGGPSNTYREETYWGRFVPGRRLGFFWQNNLRNVSQVEIDPNTGQKMIVQGYRWNNPFTNRPHGDVTVHTQNPDGSFSSVRKQYSAGGRGSNRMPGHAVGR